MRKGLYEHHIETGFSIALRNCKAYREEYLIAKDERKKRLAALSFARVYAKLDEFIVEYKVAFGLTEDELKQLKTFYDLNSECSYYLVNGRY